MQLAVCKIVVGNTNRDGIQELCQSLLVVHHKIRVVGVEADGGLVGLEADQGEEGVLLQTVVLIPGSDLEATRT